MPWTTLSDVPPNIRVHRGGRLTLAQANKWSELVDALQDQADVENPAAVAWETWEKLYRREGDIWVAVVSEVVTEIDEDDDPEWAPKPHETAVRVAETSGSLSSIEGSEGDFRLLILRAGLTGDRARYYPQATLQDAVTRRVFDGRKVYFNHQNPMEAQQGFRQVDNWVGTLLTNSVELTDAGDVVGVVHVHADRALEILRDPVAKSALGVSHDSNVVCHSGLIDQQRTEVVSRISNCHSVDFVPEGNAYGRVIEARPSQEVPEMALELETMSLGDLEQTRPDLVDEIETRAREAAEEPSTDDGPPTEEGSGSEAQHVEEGQGTPSPTPPEVDPAMSQLQTEVRELRAAEASRVTGVLVSAAVEGLEGLSEAGKVRVSEGLAGQVIAATEIEARVGTAADEVRAFELQLLQEVGAGTRVQEVQTAGSAEGVAERVETRAAEVRQRLADQGHPESEIDRLMAIK